jgi:hypothetical protein
MGSRRGLIILRRRLVRGVDGGKGHRGVIGLIVVIGD